VPDLTTFGHTHGETGVQGPQPRYVNPTGARALRLVPIPAAIIALATLVGLVAAGATPTVTALYTLAFGGIMGVVAFVVVRLSVVPRARLLVYERVFETRNPRIKHQGMHIVDVQTRGKYVFISTETDGMLTVLCSEPDKAKEALLDLRKRARET
jgi:hypothetical protein